MTKNGGAKNKSLTLESVIVQGFFIWLVILISKMNYG